MFPEHQDLKTLTPSNLIFFENTHLLGSEGVLMVWSKDWNKRDVMDDKGENFLKKILSG